MSNQYISLELIEEASKEIKLRIANAVITDLQKLQGSVYLLSGDDTYLKNVWEEYCVDQQEGTNFSDVYLQTVETYISSYIEKCSQHERVLLFCSTDSGEEKIEALQRETGIKEVDSYQIEIDLQAITDLVRWEIEEIANDFTNDNIERSINGKADDVEDEEEDSSITLNPIQAQKEAKEVIDPPLLHMMQKMNFIDSRQNRPPSYPGVEVPANFSYYTNEQMALLSLENKRAQSWRNKFTILLHSCVSNGERFLKYVLFIILSATINTFAFYWYVSLKPWENWMDFYIWGVVGIVGSMCSTWVIKFSPSFLFARYATILFSILNSCYWFYVIWTKVQIGNNIAYSSIATFMIILLGIAFITPLITKD